MSSPVRGTSPRTGATVAKPVFRTRRRSKEQAAKGVDVRDSQSTRHWKLTTVQSGQHREEPLKQRIRVEEKWIDLKTGESYRKNSTTVDDTEVLGRRVHAGRGRPGTLYAQQHIFAVNGSFPYGPLFNLTRDGVPQDSFYEVAVKAPRDGVEPTDGTNLGRPTDVGHLCGKSSIFVLHADGGRPLPEKWQQT